MNNSLSLREAPPRFSGVKMYYWKYDDKTWGFTVCNVEEGKKKKLLEHGIAGRKSELHAKIDELHKKYREPGFRKKRLSIPAGLAYIEKSDIPSKDPYDAEDGWTELERLLGSCGADSDKRRAVLQLFSGILAGYCARLAAPLCEDMRSSPVMDGAPVILVDSGKHVFDFLYKVYCSLAIDLYYDAALYFDCPHTLPPHTDARAIDDCAQLYLSKSKKNYYRKAPFPAQYRDTSVLLLWQLNNRQSNKIKFDAVLLAPCGATAKHGKYYSGNP